MHSTLSVFYFITFNFGCVTTFHHLWDTTKKNKTLPHYLEHKAFLSLRMFILYLWEELF